MDSTSTYVTELTNCDGTDSTIITNKYCTIDMLSLTSTLSLSVDTLFEIKARAHNANGWGP